MYESKQVVSTHELTYVYLRYACTLTFCSSVNVLYITTL